MAALAAPDGLGVRRSPLPVFVDATRPGEQLQGSSRDSRTFPVEGSAARCSRTVPRRTDRPRPSRTARITTGRFSAALGPSDSPHRPRLDGPRRPSPGHARTWLAPGWRSAEDLSTRPGAPTDAPGPSRTSRTQFFSSGMGGAMCSPRKRPELVNRNARLPYAAGVCAKPPPMSRPSMTLPLIGEIKNAP